MLPPSSPTSSGRCSAAARGTACSSEPAGKQRRPATTAVTAVVVARNTSTQTVAAAATGSAAPSWKHEMRTLRPGVIRGRRAEARVGEGVGVQPAPVDLDAQELLEAHVGEPHARAEVIEQRELARLRGRLEADDVEADALGEPVGDVAAEAAVGVEHAHGDGALPRLDHDLAGAGLEPGAGLGD